MESWVSEGGDAPPECIPYLTEDYFESNVDSISLSCANPQPFHYCIFICG